MQTNFLTEFLMNNMQHVLILRFVYCMELKVLCFANKLNSQNLVDAYFTQIKFHLKFCCCCSTMISCSQYFIIITCTLSFPLVNNQPKNKMKLINKANLLHIKRQGNNGRSVTKCTEIPSLTFSHNLTQKIPSYIL